jgi:hypothetical protein
MKCRLIVKLLLGFAAAAGGLLSLECRAAWTIEPVDTSGEVGWSLFIDTDAAGSLHAAYYTTNPNGDFVYSRRGSSGWQRQGIIDNADAFALDRNGDRFFVSTPGPNFYPNFQILLDNGLVLGHQLAATRSSDVVFLDFDSQNRPQIGWVDTTAQQLKHSFWNGTAWTTRTVATNPQFRFGNSGFVAALDDADQIHFAWQNDLDRLQYAKPAGATWQISSPFPTSNASPYDMVVDTNGNLHLAYDVSTGNVFTGGLFYSSYNGSTWSGGRVSGLDSFGVGGSNIVVDSGGEPHLFTYDSTFSGPKTLKHVYRNGGAWANETIDSYTSNTSGPDNIEAMLDERGYHVLYATGESEIFYAFQPVASLAGDHNGDGAVNAADFVAWRKGMGTAYTHDDYTAWRENFGRNLGTGAAAGFAPGDSTGANWAVPEPSGGLLTLVAAMFGWSHATRRCHS